MCSGLYLLPDILGLDKAEWAILLPCFSQNHFGTGRDLWRSSRVNYSMLLRAVFTHILIISKDRDPTTVSGQPVLVSNQPHNKTSLSCVLNENSNGN